MYLSLAHSAFIVVIVKAAQDLQPIVVIPQAYRRVGYPVKHSCLNDSVVDHILKNYLVANPERLVE